MKLSDDLVRRLTDLALVDKVRAIHLLRTETGCSLAEAKNQIDALTRAPLGDFESSARVFAIGTYEPSLIDCMDYGPERLAALRPGTLVCVHVSEAWHSDVEELAGVLGIDPFDISQHCLDPDAIDAESLERIDFASSSRIQRLRAAGFSFHFLLAPPVAWRT